MDLAFKRWRAANRLGFRVRNLIYRGKPLSEHQIELFNHFVESGGALEASKLHHWDAVKLFEKVVSGSGKGRSPLQA